MKTSVLLVGLLALVSLMASVSFSAPSSLGPTGILNVPTAQAVTPGGFELLLAYDRSKVGDVKVDVFPVAALTYGFSHGEVGVSYFNVKGYTAVKSINAKYIFARESEQSPKLTGPNIAAGVMYLTGNVAETDVYLVASGHSFDLNDTPGTTVATVGLLYQKPNYSASGSNLTGMMGIEVGTPGKTTIGVDYIIKDIAAGGLFGATIRQPISRDLAVQVGLGNNSRYFAGLTMKFGGK